MKKFSSVVLALLVSMSGLSSAKADLLCKITQIIYGDQPGEPAFRYPQVGDEGRFDPNQANLSRIRFNDGSFISLLDVKRVSPEENGGWQYFWNASSEDGTTRVIYTTDGDLLIQIFENYTNQQGGYSEFHLRCK